MIRPGSGKADQLLALMDLTERKNDLVKTFSVGMKRKLEIARSLMGNPKVLFLDEPTTGLDSRSRRNLWEYIQRLNENEGLTFFLTTHYIEEAEYLSDRIGIIDRDKGIIAKYLVTPVTRSEFLLGSFLGLSIWLAFCLNYNLYYTLGVLLNIIGMSLIGLFSPIESLPWPMYFIARLNPMTYAIRAARIILLKNGSLQYLLTNLIFLEVFAAAMFYLGVISLKKYSLEKR